MSDATNDVRTERCADCGRSLGRVYYATVPSFGNLCISCHANRFPPAGPSDVDAGDDELIEDRIKAWCEQPHGEEDEGHTELLCDAETELRRLRGVKS